MVATNVQFQAFVVSENKYGTGMIYLICLSLKLTILLDQNIKEQFDLAGVFVIVVFIWYILCFIPVGSESHRIVLFLLTHYSHWFDE